MLKRYTTPKRVPLQRVENTTKFTMICTHLIKTNCLICKERFFKNYETSVIKRYQSPVAINIKDFEDIRENSPTEESPLLPINDEVKGFKSHSKENHERYN